MSKLQLYAHRCPVMGKAMAVQSYKHGVAAVAEIRAFSAQSKGGKAHIHTSRNQEARAVDSPLLDGRKNGMSTGSFFHVLMALLPKLLTIVV